jgi:hypothetical protein
MSQADRPTISQGTNRKGTTKRARGKRARDPITKRNRGLPQVHRWYVRNKNNFVFRHCNRAAFSPFSHHPHSITPHSGTKSTWSSGSHARERDRRERGREGGGRDTHENRKDPIYRHQSNTSSISRIDRGTSRRKRESCEHGWEVREQNKSTQCHKTWGRLLATGGAGAGRGTHGGKVLGGRGGASLHGAGTGSNR